MGNNMTTEAQKMNAAKIIFLNGALKALDRVIREAEKQRQELMAIMNRQKGELP